MPKNAPPLAFPVRGVSGGWVDPWDDPDDHAELRARAEATEQRLEASAARIGRRWQREVERERVGYAQRADRNRKGVF